MTVTSLRARFASALALAVASTVGLAAPPATADIPPTATPALANTLAVRIAPGAAEALAVIRGYEAALPSARFDVARGFMAPAAVLIANGQVRGHRSSRPAA